MNRSEGRGVGQLRSIAFELGFAPHAAGSVLVRFGNTRVICAATVEEAVPRWMKEQGVRGGWLTAEYAKLPFSTLERKARDSSRGKVDGRSIEIQRLIGRSLRAAVDLQALGARTLWIDCDVLQADGGTRTAAITGACVAAVLAGRKLVAEGKLKKTPIRQLVSAVSVGVCGGTALLDLDYAEDKEASVDFNVVMTEAGQYVEVQGSGEEAVFSPEQLQQMLGLAGEGARQLIAAQRMALGMEWEAKGSGSC